jgi:hypothetical protein
MFEIILKELDIKNQQYIYFDKLIFKSVNFVNNDLVD